MFYLAGLEVHAGPSFTAMCSLGGGEGSIKTTLYDPCFRSIHVQDFPTILQHLSILYILTAGRQRIVASHTSRALVELSQRTFGPLTYLFQSFVELGL